MRSSWRNNARIATARTAQAASISRGAFLTHVSALIHINVFEPAQAWRHGGFPLVFADFLGLAGCP
jgi:hypothetical protein